MTTAESMCEEGSRNRFDDAALIQNPGACNPSGVAGALVRAIGECRSEDLDPRECPACQLICHQLAFLLNVSALDHDLDNYCEAMEVCGQKANTDLGRKCARMK